MQPLFLTAEHALPDPLPPQSLPLQTMQISQSRPRKATWAVKAAGCSFLVAQGASKKALSHDQNPATLSKR